MRPVVNATDAWLNTIQLLLAEGIDVTPRGLPTIEIPQHTIDVDLTWPLVAVPRRELSVRFAAAEALWMIAGDNRVESLAPYAPRMREFSDDGVILAGAYGPRIIEQFDYVVDKLLLDRNTRQAVMTIWKPCPPPSKDIPCTVALDFKIRGDRLNCHVFMRSSDAWLGLPYDVFSFSMVTAYIACRYNQHKPVAGPVALGTLYLTAASSHLYDKNFDGAAACLSARVDQMPMARVPSDTVLAGDWNAIEDALIVARDGSGVLWGNRT